MNGRSLAIRFYSGLYDLLERRVTLAILGALPRVDGPAYDPLRYSWRKAQATAEYPLVLREAATDHDVRTCDNCRTEMPTWMRTCPSCHHIAGRR